MKSYVAVTPIQIKKAVAAVKKARPAYVEILGFFGLLFDAQEDSKAQVRLEPIHTPKAALSIRARQRKPLIDVHEFVYDETASVDLFMTICHLAERTIPKLSTSARALLNAGQTKIKPANLFIAFLGGDEGLFEKIASTLEIEKQVLGFITFNSLKPSLCLYADRLSDLLDPGASWLRGGCCPICGSAPLLSILDQEGRRNMVCSFCCTVGSAKRMCCPYCDGSQTRDLQYIYFQEEKELRVEVCRNCKKYIKTIDSRKIGRPLYPVLEHLVSLHLDIKAQEAGFTPGIEFLAGC